MAFCYDHLYCVVASAPDRVIVVNPRTLATEHSERPVYL
jgi:hypothetical protein